jgi:predicted AlkP superfamily pyrophosphatase or phosphodiesterase
MKVLPDYEGGSIVNLVASIQKALGRKPKQRIVRWLPTRKLASKNIILIVIDGLGFDYIKKYGRGSFLEKNLAGKLTSVFLSTTASGLTSLTTGVPPVQHGITAWFMFIKEFGMIIKALSFAPRLGGDNLSKGAGVGARKWFSHKTVFEKIKCKSYYITGKEFENTEYTQMTSKGSKVLGYRTISDMPKKIEKIVKGDRRRKFIYAWSGDFDDLCHMHGTRSKKVKRHYKELCHHIEILSKTLRGTDTTIIITADHGQIDIPKKNNIFLNNYPKIKKCLTLPLSGEARATFCYVRPNKVAEFKRLVKKKLSGKLTLHPSEELLNKGYFGKGTPHPQISERVGDFILLAEKDHCIIDSLHGEKPNVLKGRHGGLSREEMLVPVVVIKSD